MEVGLLLEKKRYGDDASEQKEQYSVRRVTSVGSNKSRGVASVKAGLTKSTKILATAAAVGAGVYFVNSYIRAKGMGINFSSPEITNNIRKARKICKYAY